MGPTTPPIFPDIDWEQQRFADYAEQIYNGKDCFINWIYTAGHELGACCVCLGSGAYVRWVRNPAMAMRDPLIFGASARPAP